MMFWDQIVAFFKSDPITNASCDEAIRHWFGAYAAELGLKLERVNLGVPWIVRNYGAEFARKTATYDEMFYEIVASHYTLRIRAGEGPWTGEVEQINLFVTIVPTNERRDKWEDITNELGMSQLAEYHDKRPQYRSLVSSRGFWSETERMAGLARMYCTPFLLGQTDDYAKIRRFCEEESRRETAKLQKVLNNLPENVKKAWRLEGESVDDWRRRLAKAEETPASDIEDEDKK